MHLQISLILTLVFYIFLNKTKIVYKNLTLWKPDEFKSPDFVFSIFYIKKKLLKPEFLNSWNRTFCSVPNRSTFFRFFFPPLTGIIHFSNVNYFDITQDINLFWQLSRTRTYTYSVHLLLGKVKLRIYYLLITLCNKVWKMKKVFVGEFLQ